MGVARAWIERARRAASEVRSIASQTRVRALDGLVSAIAGHPVRTAPSTAAREQPEVLTAGFVPPAFVTAKPTTVDAVAAPEPTPIEVPEPNRPKVPRMAELEHKEQKTDREKERDALRASMRAQTGTKAPDPEMKVRPRARIWSGSERGRGRPPPSRGPK